MMKDVARIVLERVLEKSLFAKESMKNDFDKDFERDFESLMNCGKELVKLCLEKVVKRLLRMEEIL